MREKEQRKHATITKLLMQIHTESTVIVLSLCCDNTISCLLCKNANNPGFENSIECLLEEDKQ